MKNRNWSKTSLLLVFAAVTLALLTFMATAHSKRTDYRNSEAAQPIPTPRDDKPDKQDKPTPCDEAAQPKPTPDKPDGDKHPSNPCDAPPSRGNPDRDYPPERPRRDP